MKEEERFDRRVSYMSFSLHLDFLIVCTIQEGSVFSGE